jgi:deoxycytidylate deaminase
MDFDKIIRTYLQDALTLNKNNKSCHMAFLLHHQKIISHGFNQMDRQCFRGRAITSLHAEIDCIRKIRPLSDINRRNYKMLIIKVSRHDLKYSNSKPCDCCTKFIKDVGINHIYCSNNNGTIEKIKLDSSYIPEKIAHSLKNKWIT